MPKSIAALGGRHLIIFDGVCNFCNGAVNFIIKRDRAQLFAFSPIQSELAQRVIVEYQLSHAPDSLILIKGGKCFTMTDAMFEIIKHIDGHWRFLSVFLVLPRPLRNSLYVLFGKNRYRVFGRRDVCMVPSDKIRWRFIS